MKLFLKSTKIKQKVAKHTKVIKTYRYLKSDSSLKKLQKLEAFDNQQLFWVIQNPDHSENSKTHAKEVLKARGLEPSEIDFSVPTYIRSRNPDDLENQLFGRPEKLRKIAKFLVRTAFPLLLIWVFLGLYFESKSWKEAYEIGLVSVEEFQTETTSEIDELTAPATEYLDQGIDLETRLLETKSGKTAEFIETTLLESVMLPYMILVVTLFFVTHIIRKQPVRILLLRKFNDPKLKRSMQSIIYQLFKFGHVISLSDKFIKRSKHGWLRYVVLVVFAPVYVAFRVLILPITFMIRVFNKSSGGKSLVRTSRDFRNLIRRLTHRKRMNFESEFAVRSAILIKTSDEWWKQVIKLLVSTCDIIVIDMSSVTQGTEWEILHLQETDLFEKAVFITREDRIEEATAVMAEYNVPNSLITYDEFGDFSEPTVFKTAFIDILSNDFQNISINA